VPRVVLDPNVLTSGLLTARGASTRILLHQRSGAFELVTSPALSTELRAALRRDKFRRYVTADEADEFVELVRRESTMIQDPEASTGPIGEDPGDEYLIRLARTARADALVSGDPDLTRLKPRIPVKTPREFLDGLG